MSNMWGLVLGAIIGFQIINIIALNKIISLIEKMRLQI
tara:strand:- start:802 stop:915 length:114 start_codon:yes stop_codon:yes gene_type:complete